VSLAATRFGARAHGRFFKKHHISRAYRKISVSGRVGAALWLAERGFIGR